ncbi:MAG TPA: hypothetical protein VE960_06220 [bacterium]|nr:hypothetical protein [bacterium]
MIRKVLAVSTLALLMVSAGCVSGLGGGGGQQSSADTASTVGAIVQTDVVPGHEGIPENDSLIKPCVPLGTYARGMQPAWHVAVIDPQTGDKLTNQTVDSVTVKTDSGMTVPTEFHTDDGLWHGCFVLPEDAKTGEMQYTVIVKEGDQTFESSGSITVVEALNSTEQ